MGKTYKYKNLEFPVGDSEKVNFTVEFISNGNDAQTVVNVPGDLDPEIEDEGTEFIGLGKHLRDSITVVGSNLYNPLPLKKEDTIEVDYKINGKVIQKHKNDKNVEKRPTVYLLINFPEK